MTAFLTKILEKYKLQEYLEWQIDGQKDSIIDKLKSLTSENYYSGIFAILDLTAPKEKEYIGTITQNGFVIRKRIRPFDFLPIMAKVNAEFKTVNSQTKLIMKVNGMRKILLFVILLILAFLSLLVMLTIFEALIPPIGDTNPFPSIFMLLFIATFIVFIPCFNAVRSVRIMKMELNRILEIEKNNLKHNL